MRGLSWEGHPCERIVPGRGIHVWCMHVQRRTPFLLFSVLSCVHAVMHQRRFKGEAWRLPSSCGSWAVPVLVKASGQQHAQAAVQVLSTNTSIPGCAACDAAVAAQPLQAALLVRVSKRGATTVDIPLVCWCCS
jgi:hypothetical protein